MSDLTQAIEMTSEESAYIWTIRVQPDYRFTGNERKEALKLVDKGFLTQIDRYTFAVTELGEELYKAHNPSWCNLPKHPGLRPLFTWDERGIQSVH